MFTSNSNKLLNYKRYDLYGKQMQQSLIEFLDYEQFIESALYNLMLFVFRYSDHMQISLISLYSQ